MSDDEMQLFDANGEPTSCEAEWRKSEHGIVYRHERRRMLEVGVDSCDLAALYRTMMRYKVRFYERWAPAKMVIRVRTEKPPERIDLEEKLAESMRVEHRLYVEALMYKLAPPRPTQADVITHLLVFGELPKVNFRR